MILAPMRNSHDLCIVASRDLPNASSFVGSFGQITGVSDVAPARTHCAEDGCAKGHS